MQILYTLFIAFTIVATVWVSGTKSTDSLPDARPVYSSRTFHSSAVDSLINSLTPLFNREDLATVFSNAFPNTLDTTVYYYSPNPQTMTEAELDAFVITGDIPALWLRDSMNQVIPYLPYLSQDENLRYMIEGLINRHAHSVIMDPFANAFNFNMSGEGHQKDIRTPPMTRGVFEGKYEIDSLAAFLKLTYWYSRFVTIDNVVEVIGSKKWLRAVEILLETVSTMVENTGEDANPPYMFERMTTNALDTLMLYGRGPPAKKTGLTRSLFRPSDDAVTLPYNIPGNAMICVELTHLTSLLQTLITAKPNKIFVYDLLKQTKALTSQLCDSLLTFTTNKDNNGLIPYEVDGYSSTYHMDDANIPSLLSLPVLGYMSSGHPNYQQTRSYVLSKTNPYFFQGVAGEGVGGPHVGYNYTWPMSIIMRAMTSTNEDEIAKCLDTLLTTTAGTGLMHESFNINNASDFTRTWFAWANGLFGEMVLQLITTHPTLVLKNDPNVIAQAQSLVKPTVSLLAQSEVLVQA